MHSTHSKSQPTASPAGPTVPNPAADAAAGGRGPRRAGLAIAVLASAGIASSITQTMVTPLIPRFPAIFNAPAATTAWIITATLLAAAVAVPISGRLGDLFGKRRMILILALPLVVGALVCAAAPNVETMIVGRALQGLGSGMVPLGIAMLRDLVPRERLSSAIATVSATLGVGGAIGMPISAAVVQFADWRALFIGSAVITLIVMLAIWKLIPALPAGAAGQRFDWIGAIGITIGLVALMLAVSQGSSWGWSAPLTLSLFGVAAIALGLWGVWETRTTDPLVDLRTAVIPRVLLTNIASIFVGFGMYASMLVMPQLLQLPSQTGYGLGQSILAAGLWMAPAGLMMLLLSPVGGRLSDTRGPKFTLVLGVLVLALGYGVGLLCMGSTWGLLATSLVINSGVALAYGAMPAIIMSAVPRSETAAANGFNTLMRSIGTTVGAAVIGLVLSQMTTTLGGEPVPSEAGFKLALLLGAGISVAAAIIAACIPASRVPAPVHRVPAAAPHPERAA
ncbi:MFS transporter [Leucobacter luti]|uniref:EmrB/QacA subfamily drug resistance transporter n=1 Tax=Leucobacter luti TaxID=340320 RepID=A0A4Q7U4V6_9MICO|nr:MFS transporter [Leucobacter luti]MBL3701052.1 MFS transporter [Leucobacter luti]RZT68726.1 EmrB/QacA subfamily drug resistance transporter [Leucobacter luti]